jgi:hypothetical protein
MVLVTVYKKIPENVIQDLVRFISYNYQKNLPNSLLISQAFILKYPNYGKEFGLSAINNVVEYEIRNNVFKYLRATL